MFRLPSTFIGNRNRCLDETRGSEITIRLPNSKRSSCVAFKEATIYLSNNNFFLQFASLITILFCLAVLLTLVTFLPSQALSDCGVETKCRQEMCNFFTNIAEGRRWLPLGCLDGFYANRGDLLGFLLA